MRFLIGWDMQHASPSPSFFLRPSGVVMCMVMVMASAQAAAGFLEPGAWRLEVRVRGDHALVDGIENSK